MSLLPRVRAFGLPAYGDEEVEFFESVLERHRPTHVFEWGTNVGASARLFYEASQQLGFECDIHTVELPLSMAHLDRDHPGEHRYAQWLVGIPVFKHRGEGLTTSVVLHQELEPLRALFFLDGCHDFPVVTAELESIAELDPKAVILIHDTNQLTGRAVERFVRRNPYRREDCFFDSGLAALWPLG